MMKIKVVAVIRRRSLKAVEEEEEEEEVVVVRGGRATRAVASTDSRANSNCGWDLG